MSTLVLQCWSRSGMIGRQWVEAHRLNAVTQCVVVFSPDGIYQKGQILSQKPSASSKERTHTTLRVKAGHSGGEERQICDIRSPSNPCCKVVCKRLEKCLPFTEYYRVNPKLSALQKISTLWGDVPSEYLSHKQILSLDLLSSLGLIPQLNRHTQTMCGG